MAGRSNTWGGTILGQLWGISPQHNDARSSTEFLWNSNYWRLPFTGGSHQGQISTSHRFYTWHHLVGQRVCDLLSVQDPPTADLLFLGGLKNPNSTRMSGFLGVSNSEISHLSKLTRGIVKMLQSGPWELSPFAKFHSANLASFILLTGFFYSLKIAKIQ